LVAQRTSGACTTTSFSTIPPEYLEALIQVSVKKSNDKAVLIKEVFSHVDELKKLIVSRGLEKADPPTKDRDHTRRFDVSFGNSKDPTPWKYRESKYPEDEEDHARIREEAETTAGCWKCLLECIVNPLLKTPPSHFGCKCDIQICRNQLSLFLEIPVLKQEPLKREEERRLFRKEAVLLMTLRALRKAKGCTEAYFLREAIEDRIPTATDKTIKMEHCRCSSPLLLYLYCRYLQSFTVAWPNPAGLLGRKNERWSLVQTPYLEREESCIYSSRSPAAPPQRMAFCDQQLWHFAANKR
jgi:predicted DNA-binding protein